MNVAVDQAGGKKPPAKVARLAASRIIAEPGNSTFGDGDAADLDLAGQWIDDSGVRQKQVGRLVAPSNGDQVGEPLDSHDYPRIVRRLSCRLF